MTHCPHVTMGRVCFAAILTVLVCSPLVSTAEIPKAFLEGQETSKRSVLQKIRSPDQEFMEKVEDSVSEIAGYAYYFFDKRVLQKNFNDGTRLLLAEDLSEGFFKNISREETDNIFFRNALSHLHFKSVGSNIFFKAWRADKPVIIEARDIVFAVERNEEITDRENPVGSKHTITYSVSTTLRTARSWDGQRWSPWQDPMPSDTFVMVVVPPRDARERILFDGKPKVEISRDFGFLPVDPWDIPSPTLEERFIVLSYFVGKSSAETVAGLRKLADVGDAEAQYLLGYAYASGGLVPKDPTTACSWFSRSAERHFAPALHDLAQAYLVGEGVGTDANKAAALLHEACELGHLPSLGLLGSLMLEGKGIPKNLTTGNEYIEFAARKGEPNAMTIVARREVEAGGVITRRTLDFLRRAAANRNAEAAFLLGTLWASGRGVSQNDTTAWNWFSRAALWAGDAKELRKRSAESLLKLRDKMSEAQIEAALREFVQEKPMSDSTTQFGRK